MRARWLLTVSAILAWAFGVMLMMNAKAFEAPMGIDVTDKVATIAQAQGAILFGLGLVNWLAIGVTDRRALVAVFAGNLLVQLLSLGVVARAMALGIFPPQAIGAIVIHVALGGWFGLELVRASKAQA